MVVNNLCHQRNKDNIIHPFRISKKKKNVKNLARGVPAKMEVEVETLRFFAHPKEG